MDGTDKDTFTDILKSLFLFMSFPFQGHTVYLFHIFIYFETIFLQL